MKSVFAPRSEPEGAGEPSLRRKARVLFPFQQVDVENSASHDQSAQAEVIAANEPLPSAARNPRVILDTRIARAALDFCLIALAFAAFFIAARDRIDFMVWD